MAQQNVAARIHKSPLLKSSVTKWDGSPSRIIIAVPKNASAKPILCINVIPWRKNKIDNITMIAGRDVLIKYKLIAVVESKPSYTNVV